MVISPAKSSTFQYSVKVVNPMRKSDYTMRKLRRFTTVKEIFKEFKDSLEIVACQIGYIEPGHGLKGKQRWLSHEEDIEAMYASFKA